MATTPTSRATDAIVRAKEIAQEKGHAEVQPLHLLFSLLVPSEGIVPQVFENMGKEMVLTLGEVGDILDELDRPSRPTSNPPSSAELKEVVKNAGSVSDEWEAKQIGEEHFLIAEAVAHSHTVVTSEIPAASLKRIKIPNVCVGLNIPYVNTFHMLRREHAQFVLPSAT